MAKEWDATPDEKERIHRGYFIARKDSLEGLPAVFTYLKSYAIKRGSTCFIYSSLRTLTISGRKLQEVVGQSQQNWRGNGLPREATPPLETHVPSFSHCLWGHCQRDLPGRISVVGQNDLLAPSDTGISQLCLGGKISAYPPSLPSGLPSSGEAKCGGQLPGVGTVPGFGDCMWDKVTSVISQQISKVQNIQNLPQNVIVYL